MMPMTAVMAQMVVATKAIFNSRSNTGRGHNSLQFPFPNLERFGVAVVLKYQPRIGQCFNSGRQGRCHKD